MSHSKLLPFLLLMVFCANLSNAQDKILIFKGNVTNSSGEALNGVSLIIRDSTKFIGYCISTNNGDYVIEVKASSKIKKLDITAGLMGYKSASLPIILSTKTLFVKDFSLIQDILELKEISISRAKTSIIQKGDTTSFNLQAFRQGNEQTVEDIVKKMPGFSVNDDGDISFQGQKIDKVLIDNEDFYKEKYKNLTQHFNQRNIDTIEVIENYVEEEILSNFAKSGKTVLNLNLTKIGGVHSSGGIGLAYGTAHRFEGVVDNVSWKNSFKLVSLASVNNTSNSTVDQIRDPFILNSLNSFISPKIEIGNSLPSTLMNSNLMGKKFTLNPNFVYRPLKNLTIKGSGTYNNQKIINHSTSSTLYFNEVDFLNERTNSTDTVKNDFLDYELEAKSLLNSHARLKYTIGYVTSNAKSNEQDSIFQSIGRSMSSYLPKQNYRRFSNTLSYLDKLTPNSVLNIISTVNNFHIMENDQNEFSTNNFSILDASQNLKHNNFVSDSYLKLFIKENKNLSAFTLGISYNNERINSDLNLYDTTRFNNAWCSMIDYYAKYSFNTELNNYSLALNSSLHLTRNRSYNKENISKNFLLPNFNIKNRFKLNSETSISLSLNHENVYNGVNQIFTEIIMTGNRLYTKNSPTNRFFFKKTDITLVFAYNDLFEKQMSLNGFFILGKKPVTANLYEIDLITTNSLVFNSYTRFYNISNINFSKLIPFISSNLKLEFSNYNSQFLSAINSGQLKAFKSGNTTIGTKLISALAGNVNGEVGFTTSIQTLKDKTISSPPIMYQSKLNFYISHRNIDLSSKNTLIFYNKEISPFFLISTLRTNYKIKSSKLSISFDVNNLFDTKGFIRQNKNNLYSYTNDNELTGRYYLLSCNYNF